MQCKYYYNIVAIASIATRDLSFQNKEEQKFLQKKGFLCLFSNQVYRLQNKLLNSKNNKLSQN